MTCPDGHNVKDAVIDSRDSGRFIRRRRECVKCRTRWTTYEITNEEYEALLKRPAIEDTPESVQVAMNLKDRLANFINEVVPIINGEVTPEV